MSDDEEDAAADSESTYVLAMEEILGGGRMK
jgi:hypothetical protein